MKHEYRGLVFDVPEMPKDGLVVQVSWSEEFLKDHSGTEIYESKALNDDWNLEEFDSLHLPIHVQEVSFPEFSFTRILDMPVKFPSDNDYRIPRPLLPYLGLICQVASIERFNIKSHEDFYAYLTIDEKIVQPNEEPRSGGCHVDGFQGSRISPKVRPDHSYIAVSGLPTVFYEQVFSSKHLDPKRHNFFKFWDRIALEENERTIAKNWLYFMDAYIVHRSKGYPTISPVKRQFFRLAYSVRQFDRLGNTHNPMFDYDWEMAPRKVAEELVTPE